MTQTSRVTTPEVVLGSSQALFLPEDHPLLNTVNQSFGSFGVQGRISASFDGPSLYHLELMIQLGTVEGDALVSSLSSCSPVFIIVGATTPLLL